MVNLWLLLQKVCQSVPVTGDKIIEMAGLCRSGKTTTIPY